MTLREVPAMKFLSIHHGLAAMLVTLAMVPSASALTLKTGEVLGSDGKVYEAPPPKSAKKSSRAPRMSIFSAMQKSHPAFAANHFTLLLMKKSSSCR